MMLHQGATSPGSVFWSGRSVRTARSLTRGGNNAHTAAEPIEKLIPHCLVKFVLNAKTMRRKAMAELYQMNISNATLFPGLDGLARSLAYELEFHLAFDPVTMEERPGYKLQVSARQDDAG